MDRFIVKEKLQNLSGYTDLKSNMDIFIAIVSKHS